VVIGIVGLFAAMILLNSARALADAAPGGARSSHPVADLEAYVTNGAPRR
jgi:hypothetical protein